MPRRQWWIEASIFALLFVAMTGVGVQQLVLACVVGALVATVAAGIQRRQGTFRVGFFFRFLPYFLAIAVRGGIDVARRALAPSMPIRAGFVDYRLRVDPRGRAAAFFGAAISLVPGTLCVELEGEPSIRVHLIDLDGPYLDELRHLERRVAAIFAENLDERGHR